MSNPVELELRGPEFVQSAVEISQKVSVKSISRLYVYNVTADAIKALETALSKLRGYFTNNALVVLTSPQQLPFQTAFALQIAGGVPVTINGPIGSTNPNSLFQMQASEMQNSQTILTQTAANAQKQRAERWKIMQETQTKIFEITQDITANKARTQDKMFQQWNAYIRM